MLYSSRTMSHNDTITSGIEASQRPVTKFPLTILVLLNSKESKICLFYTALVLRVFLKYFNTFFFLLNL